MSKGEVQRKRNVGGHHVYQRRFVSSAVRIPCVRIDPGRQRLFLGEHESGRDRLESGSIRGHPAGRYAFSFRVALVQRGYDATRYSSLSQINTNNVAFLAEVARFKLPETTSFQSGPVLIAGTMYVTTANNTYALDSVTGEQRWIQRFEPKTLALARRCAEWATRMAGCSAARLTDTCWRLTPKPAR
jgi:hypothetical protein